MLEQTNNRLFYLLVYSIFLANYLLTLSNNQAIAHDGIIYAARAKEGMWVFHPHHLLYHVFTLLVVKGVLFFFPSCEVYLILSGINSVFGAALVTLFCIILIEQYKFDKIQAISASLLVAFSYGIWYYSTCVEVYIIPLFFAALSLYFFLKNPDDYLKIALFSALATLFHQTYVFLLLVYLISFLYSKTKFSTILKFGTLFLLLVAISYVLVLIFDYKAKSISDAYYHLTFYAQKLPFFWSKPGVSIIFNDLVGFSRVIFSIHLLLGLDFVQNVIYNYFPSHSFKEEFYLIRNASNGEIYFALLLLLSLCLLFCYFFIISIKNFIKNKSLKVEKVWLISYLIFFVGFFSFWSSNNLEFWISIYFFLIIFLIVFNTNKVRYKLYLTIGILLFVFNFTSTTQFVLSSNNDFYQNKIEKLKSTIEMNDVLVIDNDNYMLSDYLVYNDFKNIKEINHLDINEENKVYFVGGFFYSNDELSDEYIKTISELKQANKLISININNSNIYKLHNLNKIKVQ
ncbi:MAG TPA: hypothetical protein PLU67_06785 [Candidatus Kapabacteria bacterium]|nr:hypothetical protein [Candidatus Kapabacteria bacterium]HPP38942.1 hypothetical protein [Candidatus Kapabacteria bacterium]